MMEKFGGGGRKDSRPIHIIPDMQILTANKIRSVTHHFPPASPFLDERVMNSMI